MVLLHNISKVFHLYSRPSDRVRRIIPLVPKRAPVEFWALRDINLTVDRGQIVSLIGPNGSGKSTLLQIVAGIIRPTSGRVVTRGRIAALLELGAGFNPEFSGRENVFISGEIMGLSRAELERVYPKIEAFAEIGNYIHRPVKEYSSGMYVRLAFATAIHVDPEVLIVDEALSVGDAVFASRCVQKFEELKSRKVTILFVSHDLGLVKRLSDRALFLNNGKIEAEGNPRDVVNRYVGVVLERQKRQEVTNETRLQTSFRHGDGTSEIASVDLLDANGNRCTNVLSGQPVTIRVVAQFRAACDDPVVGVLIRNRLGMDVFGTNTKLLGKELGRCRPGDRLTVSFSFDCALAQQEYTLTVATQHQDGSSQDWLDDVVSFRVTDPRGAAGAASFETKVGWQRA